MLIETTAGDLRMALAGVKAAVPLRSTLPILCSVLLQDGAVRATNLDMEITIKFATTHFEGGAAIPFRQLNDLVCSLPADMSLRLQAEPDSYRVYIHFRGGRYKLAAYPAKDFPEWAVPDGLKTMRAPDGLRAALDVCRSFVSDEETRYYLNGVCFAHDKDGKPVLVATDGHRLAAHDYAHDCEGRQILPNMALDALLALPEPRSVLVDDVQMIFGYPGGRLCTKLIQGDFPDWTRVVPELTASTPLLTFSPLEMMRVLTRMQRLVGSPRGRAVDISAPVAGDMIVLACKGMDEEECTERLESGSATDWRGPSDLRSFNSRYLREICRVHRHAERISIASAEKGAPAIVGSNDSNVLTILMPMRNDVGLVGPALMAFSTAANEPDEKERAA